MKHLEKRDNEVYRSIFEAAPIPDSARAKQLEKRKELQMVAGMDQSELTNQLFKTNKKEDPTTQKIETDNTKIETEKIINSPSNSRFF